MSPAMDDCCSLGPLHKINSSPSSVPELPDLTFRTSAPFWNPSPQTHLQVPGPPESSSQPPEPLEPKPPLSAPPNLDFPPQVAAPPYGPAIHPPAASCIPKRLQPHSIEPHIGAARREGECLSLRTRLPTSTPTPGDCPSPFLQAPELLLPKAASLRQDLLFLQDQRSLRCWYLLHMKTSLPPGPSTQGRPALLPYPASQPLPRTISVQEKSQTPTAYTVC